ncbi:hypothetical protein FBU59_000081 [Linderina macrospora]|uniref:Uncharacterized protein n=1 Tax=Linderina macrospora TaxID=4868 RepID=A0ACC1JHW0_9FUNG|nr:hypothetical protein FBU59_000081 [Linderina macrospora]
MTVDNSSTPTCSNAEDAVNVHPTKLNSIYDPDGIGLSIVPLSDPTREQLETFTYERMKHCYAAKASLNKDLPLGSIPSGIPAARERSLKVFPQIDDVFSIVDYQGVFQSFLVSMVNAKRILEIGTFMGISAIFHANALKRSGVKGGADETGYKPIVCLEISEQFAEVARSNFVDAGVEEYIEVIVGDANRSLAQLRDVTFDIVFIDADKDSYKSYYDTAIGDGLLNRTGILIVDNTAFQSVVSYMDAPVPVDPEYKPLSFKFDMCKPTEDWGITLHEFNEYIRNDPRTEVVMLPLFTGITLVRFVN